MRLQTPKDVGLAIRQKRRALALPQAALARRAGVSRQWIIEAERGKRRMELDLVLRTFRALGLVLSTGESPAAPAADGLRETAIDIDGVIEAHRRPRPGRP